MKKSSQTKKSELHSKKIMPKEVTKHVPNKFTQIFYLQFMKELKSRKFPLLNVFGPTENRSHRSQLALAKYPHV